jgi:hypothetical protein
MPILDSSRWRQFLRATCSSTVTADWIAAARGGPHASVSGVEEERRNGHGDGLVGPQLQRTPLVAAAENVLVDASHPRRVAVNVVARVLCFVFGNPKEALE